MAESNSASTGAAPMGCLLPRVTIQFCTQCKWMLRAAYFAQELLSTFGLSLGEVALQPSTGGTFVVTIHHQQQQQQPPLAEEGGGAGLLAQVTSTVLWDRKVDGGFPETKELKRRVRDVIEPGRDLGHVDRNHGAAGKGSSATVSAATAAEPREPAQQQQQQPEAECKDCQ